MPVNEDLKKIVVCPKCKGPLQYNEVADGFDCSACKLRYLIEDGIANFLIESAKEIKGND